MKGQVLLLDDSPMDLKIASSVLERNGFACHSFTDATEAFLWLEKETPRLIFLDLQMPKVSGFDLIPKFKEHPNTRQTPILIMSGKNQIADVKRAIQLGATDYLIKPLDTLVLQEKIKSPKLTQSEEEFAAVAINETEMPKLQIVTPLKIISISEFGMKVRSQRQMWPGEVVEIAGLPIEGMGNQAVMVRCLSIDQDNNMKDYVLQTTFVGLTEGQRQSIRTYCRKRWVYSKGSAA